MLKILMLSHYFNPDVGGIETNSEILATAFVEQGAAVHILTWTRQQSEKDFPFTVIRDPGLHTILSEHRWADVVFENNPCLKLSWPNIFIRRPLIIALNTWVSRIHGRKGTRDRLKQLWFYRANKVIAVSDAVRKKEWPRAVVIENAYNDQLFNIIPGIERTIPFVFLGRLVSDKGAIQAIEAVADLVREGVLDKNKIQLTVIGDGPEKQKLLAAVKKYDLESAVQLTGILRGRQLAECLNRHLFILVPSAWQEPYGNVVLEGMACGCVPVASNGGGLPEAVGNAGFLFKRNCPGGLAAVLKANLFNEPALAIKKAFAVSHLRQHTVELVAEKYFQFIKSAATGHHERDINQPSYR